MSGGRLGAGQDDYGETIVAHFEGGRQGVFDALSGGFAPGEAINNDEDFFS